MRAEIRPTAEGDLGAVIAAARPADVAEMAALGMTFPEALQGSLNRSDWSATGVVDGEPVCMFGVAPVSLLGGIGAPWMLGTTALDRPDMQVPFLRASRGVVAAMLATYPRLINLVDTRNTIAIRWLRWLGFTFDPDPVPVRGQQFRIFRKDAPHV